MKENFLKRQSDVMEDLRSMRSELKNLLVKYPEDDELEVELFDCSNEELICYCFEKEVFPELVE